MGVNPTLAAALVACGEPQVLFMARQLSRKAALRGVDRDEIEQHLRMQIFLKAHLYDESRGAMSTFVKTVVQSAAAMLLRSQRRFKRGGGCTIISLEDAIANSEGEMSTLANVASPDDQNRRTGNDGADDLDHQETADAVNHEIESLDLELKKIAEALKRAGTVTGAAKLLGIRRQKIYDALPELHKRFGDAQ